MRTPVSLPGSDFLQNEFEALLQTLPRSPEGDYILSESTQWTEGQMQHVRTWLREYGGGFSPTYDTLEAEDLTAFFIFISPSRRVEAWFVCHVLGTLITRRDRKIRQELKDFKATLYPATLLADNPVSSR